MYTSAMKTNCTDHGIHEQETSKYSRHTCLEFQLLYSHVLLVALPATVTFGLVIHIFLITNMPSTIHNTSQVGKRSFRVKGE